MLQTSTHKKPTDCFGSTASGDTKITASVVPAFFGGIGFSALGIALGIDPVIAVSVMGLGGGLSIAVIALCIVVASHQPTKNYTELHNAEEGAAPTPQNNSSPALHC